MALETITEAKQLEKIEDQWNNLLAEVEENSIFLTHQWFCSWWKCFSKGQRLEILVVKDKGGKLLGIAPLMRESNTISFLASHEVSDYCDFLISKNRQKEFFTDLLAYFNNHRPGIKRIELINIKSSSSTLTYLPQLARRHGFIVEAAEAETAPYLELPSSYEDFMLILSRKDRHELRRKLRKMSGLGRVKVKQLKDLESLKTWLPSFIELHRASSSFKEAFWSRPGMVDFFEELAKRFSPQAWIELSLLLQREKIMAVLLSFVYQDEIYFYNTAYSRHYAFYSPGLFLFNYRLQQAIAERKRKADFLRGKERYKYYFGTKECRIYNLTFLLE